MWSQTITSQINRARDRSSPVLHLLFAYLAAITIFGKGPTYLGIGNLYWAELTMIILLGWMICRTFRASYRPRLSGKLSLFVLAYMLLGVALTIPSFAQWGLDALRDAAIWYYAAFYFVGSYISKLPVYANHLWRCFVWMWLAAVVWNLVVSIGGDWIVTLSPTLPWRGVPLLSGSGNENIMHTFLGSVLLLLRPNISQERFISRILFAGLMLLSLGIFLTSYGRGVKIAVLAAIAIGALATFGRLRRFRSFGTFYITCFVLIWITAFALAFLPVKRLMETAHLHRFAEIWPKEMQGTAYWRMVWWENIVDSVHRYNPVFGLGFGLNLGVANPYLEADLLNEWPVRSPHNINLTVFARMGYLGLWLWTMILVYGIGTLFLRVRKGGISLGDYTSERYRELAFWIVMLISTWLNSSFSVLMEGPVLGVWFWFALGFATGRSGGKDGIEPIIQKEI